MLLFLDKPSILPPYPIIIRRWEIVVKCTQPPVLVMDSCSSFNAVDLLAASWMVFLSPIHQFWRNIQFLVMSLLCHVFSAWWWLRPLWSMVHLILWKFFWTLFLIDIFQQQDPSDAVEAFSGSWLVLKIVTTKWATNFIWGVNHRHFKWRQVRAYSHLAWVECDWLPVILNQSQIPSDEIVHTCATPLFQLLLFFIHILSPNWDQFIYLFAWQSNRGIEAFCMHCIQYT